MDICRTLCIFKRALDRPSIYIPEFAKANELFVPQIPETKTILLLDRRNLLVNKVWSTLLYRFLTKLFMYNGYGKYHHLVSILLKTKPKRQIVGVIESKCIDLPIEKKQCTLDELLEIQEKLTFLIERAKKETNLGNLLIFFSCFISNKCGGNFY